MRPRSPGGGQAGDILRGLQKSCSLARPARGSGPALRPPGPPPRGHLSLWREAVAGREPPGCEACAWRLTDSGGRDAASSMREGPGGPGHTAQARLQRQNLLPELWAGGQGSRCHRGLLRAPGVSSTSARLGAPGVPGPVASSLPPSSLGPLPRVCVSTRHLPLTRSPVRLEGDPPWWPRLAQLHLRRPVPVSDRSPGVGCARVALSVNLEVPPPPQTMPEVPPPLPPKQCPT